MLTKQEMPKFRIGEYCELHQGSWTPHVETTIKAKDLEEAKRIAKERFGWGAICYQISCSNCGAKPKDSNQAPCRYCFDFCNWKTEDAEQ